MIDDGSARPPSRVRPADGDVRRWPPAAGNRVRPAAVHFWGLPWPKLPGLGFLMTPDHKAWRRELTHIHVYILIWLVILNLALHVAGAIRHQFVGHSVLWRMAPLRVLKR